ncbi:hypothetical protein L1987_80730 [Smallanthus sonchifolius]|uniref:Uncharacterized protein n=1 Tax=Smallanthus sonchifolius TaxID=185202 RepID=A0ACB8YSR4_9ASTR|nr:hypothetical protein L1987_80730 [Smallanthus sonchifolius]
MLQNFFGWRIWASLVPNVGGILLSYVTELIFNVFGFCVALFGCLSTSTKTTIADLWFMAISLTVPLHYINPPAPLQVIKKASGNKMDQFMGRIAGDQEAF